MRAANGWGILPSKSEPVPRSPEAVSSRRLRSAITTTPLNRRDAARDEVQPAARHETDWNSQSRAILKLRDQVRCADVQGHACRYREPVRAQKTEMVRQQD